MEEDTSALRDPMRDENLRLASKCNVQAHGFCSIAIKIGDISVIVYGDKLEF